MIGASPQLKPRAPKSQVGGNAWDAGRAALRDLIRRHCIVRAEQQLILSPKAQAQAWMIDARRLALDPVALPLIADLFWQRFESHWPFQLGGLEVGAIPLVAAVQMEGSRRGLPINAFLVRKERKRSGLGNLLEGKLDDTPIIVIDDILHSGASLEKVRALLQGMGRSIADVFVLVDYQAPGGDAWRARHTVPITAACRLSELGLSLGGRPRPAPVGRFDVLWRYGAPAGHFFDKVPKAAPAVDDSRVLFGTDNGSVIALDQLTGTKVWSFKVNGAPPLKGVRSAPAVHQGQVFFGAYNGSVYALDAATGTLTWQFEDADWVGSSPTLAPDLELLFIGLERARPDRKGGLAALDLITGAHVWEMPFADFVHGSPTYVEQNRTVLVGSNEGTVVSAEARTGEEIWRLMLNTPVKAGIAVDPAAQLAVFGAFDRHIYGVDLDTGLVRWRVETGYAVYTTPLIHGGFVFFGSADKHFYVLDARRGTILRRIPIGAKVFSAPRFADGAILFGANDGVVYELDVERLEVIGRLQLTDCLTNAIAQHNSRFFALTYMGEMACFHRSSR